VEIVKETNTSSSSETIMYQEIYKFYKFTQIRTRHVDHIDEIPDEDDTLVKK
jgi:hypothetical protein